MNKIKSPFKELSEQIPIDIRNALAQQAPASPEMLSRSTGYTWQTVKRQLDRMEAEGIVESQRVGRVFIYTLHEEKVPE
jgi:DNA-binding transcriptional ArsR family regulator